LKNHLENAKKNATYTSKTIQNDFIDVIGEYIRDKLMEKIKQDGSVFTIIADETTDMFNQEVLTLCLRFAQSQPNVEIKEVFFDFAHLRRTSGEKIADAIIESCSKHNIDITKHRGQAYDGAAAMSSGRIGVQARIKEKSPLALYMHCNSDVLNLSIAAACKLSPIRNMIDSLNETDLCFNNSPKQQAFFELVIEKEEILSNGKKLKGLCKTRWVERHLQGRIQNWKKI
jgi:hypothetical protein